MENFDFSTFISYFASTITIALITSNALSSKNHDQNKEKSKEYLYFKYIILTLNGLFWSIYGLKIDSKALFACNIFGLLVYTYSLVNHIIAVDNERKIKYISIMVFSLIMIYLIFHSHYVHTYFSGVFALLISILSRYSALVNIKDTMDQKDKSNISIKSVLLCIISSMAWILFGILENHNLFLIIPNLINSSIFGFQIYLYELYSIGRTGNSFKEFSTKMTDF